MSSSCSYLPWCGPSRQHIIALCLPGGGVLYKEYVTSLSLEKNTIRMQREKEID